MIKSFVPSMAFVFCALFATAGSAQESANPNSDYAVCHGNSPPGWCLASCGPNDTWCEFAGLSCTSESAFFEEIPGVKPGSGEMRTEQCTSDGGTTWDWCDDSSSDESSMEAYYMDLSSEACNAEFGLPIATCVALINFEGGISCNWSDFHCTYYSSGTCLQRGT